MYSQRVLLLNKIIKFMHENYANDTEIKLSTIADRFNLNIYHFCHIFKEFTGKTMKEYLNNLRIEKAEQLLVNTDAAIGEVAFLCGFNDSNYFSRKFRQIKGKSPREWRRILNENR